MVYEHERSYEIEVSDVFVVGNINDNMLCYRRNGELLKPKLSFKIILPFFQHTTSTKLKLGNGTSAKPNEGPQMQCNRNAFLLTKQLVQQWLCVND